VKGEQREEKTKNNRERKGKEKGKKGGERQKDIDFFETRSHLFISHHHKYLVLYS